LRIAYCSLTDGLKKNTQNNGYKTNTTVKTSILVIIEAETAAVEKDSNSCRYFLLQKIRSLSEVFIGE